MTTSSCYHCGETVPTGVHIYLQLDGSDRPMCCPACLAVSQCIQSAGLSDYYRLRSETATTPQSKSIDYTQYDHSSAIEEFSTRQNKLWRSRLCIDGLHCVACSWLIEQGIGELVGVKSVIVNVQKNTASIEWDDAEINISTIFNTIENLGYNASAYTEQSKLALDNSRSSELLKRIGLAGIAMMQVTMVAIALYAGAFQGMDDDMRKLLRYFSLIVVTPVITYSAAPFFKGALRGIRQRQLGMDVPVSIALAAAFIASLIATLNNGEHVYYDTIVMFTFFLLVSRYLQLRVQQHYEAYSNALPHNARLLTIDNSQWQWQAVSKLKNGDRLLVHPGETVPSDGTIIDGCSSIDNSAFSGEFLPQYVTAGENILAGSANIDGSLTVKVGCSSSEYQYHQIDNLLEQAQRVKPKASQLADHIAAYFVALVLVCSALSAVYWFLTTSADTAFVIGLSVLVVSCPCALSLATPLTLTAAVNGLRREGIVVKNAEAFNTAKQLSYAIFDKTGTLTKGQPHIVDIDIFSSDSEAVLVNIAASLEHTSSHPIAKAFDTTHALLPVHKMHIFAGDGIEGFINGFHYKLGSASFCNIEFSSLEKTSNIVVHLCRNNEEIARFKLDDEIREDAGEIIKALRSRNIEIQVLSGDCSQHVNTVASALGITQVFSGRSSAQKLAHIRRLQNTGAQVMMVGDGVNDAPVIAAADISFAMSDASEVTRSHADVILLNNRLSGVSQFFNTAQNSRKILLQNISWAIAYNATALPLAAIGLIPPYIAAIGMSASSLLVLLNAMRLARPVQKQNFILTAANLQAAAETSANG